MARLFLSERPGFFICGLAADAQRRYGKPGHKLR
jgi:hypothetical protein